MKNPKRPAGLEDADLEIYAVDNQLHCTYQGKAVDFIELPYTIRQIFEVDLIKDPVSQKSLQEDLGITDSEDMLQKHVMCNYGGFDFVPDLHGHKTSRECWDCGEHGACPGEGKVCKLPAGPLGALSKREYQVTMLVARGKLDKEIAFELHIEETSVREYQKRIRSKIEANNRIEIMLWAQRTGLI